MRAVRRNKAVLWGLPVVWMGVIFYLSAQSTLPELTPGTPDLQSIAGHVLSFALLAILWWRAFREAGVRRPALWAFAVTVAYGGLDELHQKFVPGRTPDLVDLSLDAIGAAVALLVATTRSKASGRTEAAGKAAESGRE